MLNWNFSCSVQRKDPSDLWLKPSATPWAPFSGHISFQYQLHCRKGASGYDKAENWIKTSWIHPASLLVLPIPPRACIFELTHTYNINRCRSTWYIWWERTNNNIKITGRTAENTQNVVLKVTCSAATWSIQDYNCTHLARFGSGGSRDRQEVSGAPPGSEGSDRGACKIRSVDYKYSVQQEQLWSIARVHTSITSWQKRQYQKHTTLEDRLVNSWTINKYR